MFELIRTLFRMSVAVVIAVLMIVSQNASHAQESQAESDRVSVPQLMKNLDSNRLSTAATAARTLGVIFSPGGRGGEELEQVTQMLIERIDSAKGADLRRECARALGRMKSTAATEKMKLAMADEDIEVAMAAGEAIGRILPLDEAREYLTEQGTDADEHTLVASLHGLAPICKADDVPLLKQGLASSNWRAQQDAVRGMERAVRSGGNLTAEDYDAVANVLGNNITTLRIKPFTSCRISATMIRLQHCSARSMHRVTARSRIRLGESERTAYAHFITAIRRAQKRALPNIIRQLGDKTANVTNEAKRILTELRKERYVSQSDSVSHYS